MNIMVERFYDEYVDQLTAEITAPPDEYRYPVTYAPMVARKMVLALAKGTANKDSRAIRRTCRKLGIPYTYKAIRDYLDG